MKPAILMDNQKKIPERVGGKLVPQVTILVDYQKQALNLVEKLVVEKLEVQLAILVDNQ